MGAEADARDHETKNALAAKGYRLAFEEVREDIRRSWMARPRRTDRATAPGLVSCHVQPLGDSGHHQGASTGWLSVSHNVYLRGSSHVPLPPHAIADAMDALFESISEEPDPRVKAILAPFLFTYIHPFPDGNGRRRAL